MKLMKHPLHGWHHAYNNNEEEAMRKNGWVDAEEAPAPAVIPVAEPESTPAPVARKPGRSAKAK